MGVRGHSTVAMLLVLSVFSCSVEELSMASTSTVINSCQEDADCRTLTSSLGVCGSGMCVSHSDDIDEAFLEVIPPASAFFGAGDSFLITLDNLARGDWSRAIDLPRYAEVEGKLTTTLGLLGEPPSHACENAFDTSTQSLQVNLEFSRSDAVRGLPGLTVAGNTQKINSGWVFSGRVPAGRYDVYATALSGCDADFPPLLAPAQWLESGTVKLELHVAALSTLSGIVTPPMVGTNGHVSLAGWQVSLVEPDRGRVISTTRQLNDSNPTNFELRYQPLANSSPLLQLMPPKSAVAPTIFWDLSVLDLDGDGQVQPNLSSLDLSTVQVSATIVDGAVAPVADATIRLRSTHLIGAAHGLSARYETVATSDGEGAFTLMLLPGTYQVVATPPVQTGLAVTESTWTIGRAPAVQAGRTVELFSLPVLQGSVRDPLGGQPIAGITVSVLPSAMESPRFLDRVLGPSSVIPRGTSGLTGPDGSFGIGVDPGIVDVSAQPVESSRFPWLVRARVQVPDDQLGEMALSFPVPLAGTLRDPSGNPVQQALLRVFAPTDPLNLNAKGVLQVAEGRTDKLGGFVLLLPSDLRGD